jgi:hypothetical protein
LVSFFWKFFDDLWNDTHFNIRHPEPVEGSVRSPFSV